MPRRARRSPRYAADSGLIPRDRPPASDDAVALRPFVTEDAPALARACRDPDIVRWTFMPEQMTDAAARDWIERADAARRAARAVRFAVVDASDGTFLGQAGIGRLNWEERVGEIFYWVLPEARGRGVATRVARLLADWGFAVLRLERIEIVVDPRNEVSQRVATAAGFTREGLLRSYQRFKQGRMDAVMFSRLPDDEQR